jgi:hypothetical protein
VTAEIDLDTRAAALAHGRKLGKRERAWMLRHATMGELHTSEDYPRKLEALGLIVRRSEGASGIAYFAHEHVLTPTPLFEAVIRVWAHEAAGRLSEAAILALSPMRGSGRDDELLLALGDADRQSLADEGAIDWNGPPWRRVGRWEVSSFGCQIRRAHTRMRENDDANT